MVEIRIENIYYMLCYAWKYLEEGRVVPFDAVPTTKLVNLFAKVLVKNVTEMQKRGLHRIYVQNADEGRSFRGKLDVSNTLSRMLLQQGKVACHYTELSTDTDLNRIVKATALALACTEEIDDVFVHPLRALVLKMPEVKSITLSKRVFNAVRFNRLTVAYRPTFKMCELIFDQLLPKDDPGKFYFRDFIRDEKLMRRVFEDFVRNFYELEQNKYPVVRRERLSWQAEGTPDDVYRLPMMETDTSLTRGEDRVVVETKYYADALVSGRSEKETVRSEHLYQLASYLQNFRARSNGNLKGVLLYPALGRDIDLSYKIWGIPLSVCTVNLNQDWKLIHDGLLNVVKAA